MKKFSIEGIQISDIISNIADILETKYTESFGEYTLEIPKKFGEGVIEGINFPNGVGLLKYDCTFKEDIILSFKSEFTHPLKFIYCVCGSFNHSFGDDPETHHIEPFDHIIVSGKYHQSHNITFFANQHIYLRSLEINRKLFQQQLTGDLTKIDPDFYKMLADVNAINTIYYKGNYGLKISDIIYELDHFEETGLVRASFLGSKALEILSYLLLEYKDDLEEDTKKKIIRKSEIYRIEEAVKHIDSNLTELGTIDEIAKHVGINPIKLQQGFKILFHQTVNEYIQNRRLEEAMSLLSRGIDSVSEVVYAIGFSSRSHFAKIFKDKYNVSPSQFIKNVQKNQEDSSETSK